MKIIGKPNAVAVMRPTKRDRKTFLIRKRPTELFKFDEDGIAFIDEKDFTKMQLAYIKRHYKIEETKYKCKKCDYETDNRGELLAHYKSEHPKE